MASSVNATQGLLMKLKEFFGYSSLKEFRDDWSKLTDQEKEWFKSEIQKVTN